MYLKIVSQKGLTVEKEGVLSVTLPGKYGQLTILSGHEAVLCELVDGPLFYKWKEENLKQIESEGRRIVKGLLKVENDEVLVLSES